MDIVRDRFDTPLPIFDLSLFASLTTKRRSRIGDSDEMLVAGELHLPDSELKIAANRALALAPLDQALGSLCQMPLWRAAAGLKLPGRLHIPRRAEQPPYWRRQCAAPDRHLHLSRRPARLTAQGVNPLRPGVHPALQFAYPTSGFGANPTLWNPRQQSQWYAQHCA